MDSLKQAKLQAKHLRLEVAALGVPVPLNDEQSLALAARANGHADWAALEAAQARTYFHTRHLPYLPNTVTLVRALSTRRAAIEDLADIESRIAKTPENWSSQWVVAVATERALRQAREAIQQQLTLHPALTEAVLVGVTGHLAQLRKAEAAAEHELARPAADDSYLLRRSEPYRALAHQTGTQAERYHAAYLCWRLATLSASLCAVCERQGAPAMAGLLAEGTDLFTYVGAFLRHAGMSDTTQGADEGQVDRAIGKTVLLNVQANGSMESSLQFPGSLPLPNAAALGVRLLERFPEIAFWHAWVELKPLLAPGIDDLIA